MRFFHVKTNTVVFNYKRNLIISKLQFDINMRSNRMFYNVIERFLKNAYNKHLVINRQSTSSSVSILKLT